LVEAPVLRRDERIAQESRHVVQRDAVVDVPVGRERSAQGQRVPVEHLPAVVTLGRFPAGEIERLRDDSVERGGQRLERGERRADERGRAERRRGREDGCGAEPCGTLRPGSDHGASTISSNASPVPCTAGSYSSCARGGRPANSPAATACAVYDKR